MAYDFDVTVNLDTREYRAKIHRAIARLHLLKATLLELGKVD